MVHEILQQVEELNPEIRDTGRGQFPRHLPVRKEAGNDTGKGHNGLRGVFHRMLQEGGTGEDKEGEQIHTSRRRLLPQMRRGGQVHIGRRPEQLREAG